MWDVYAIQKAEEHLSENILENRVSKELSVEARQNLVELLHEKGAVWKDTKLGKCTVIAHGINTGEAEPYMQLRCGGSTWRKGLRSLDRLRTFWKQAQFKRQQARGQHRWCWC